MKPPAARGEAHKYTSWSLNERPGTVALTDRSNEVLLALEGDAPLAALPQAHFRVVWRVRWYAISFLLGQPICICWLRNVVHTVDGILKAQVNLRCWAGDNSRSVSRASQGAWINLAGWLCQLITPYYDLPLVQEVFPFMILKRPL